VQSVFQPSPWHAAQETDVEPPTPSSAAPWQDWQLASAEFAEYAWNDVLAVSIHVAAWPSGDFTPHGWHASQVMLFWA
jgi:hypothetical protein